MTTRPWQESALQALEWHRFLALARAEARTEPGRARLDALREPTSWAQDVAEAQLRQAETQEISQLLDRDALWGPLTELSDPAVALDALARGAVLELAQLVAVRHWVYAIDSWSQVPRDEIRGERVKKAIASLPEPFQALRILEKVLTPEGELSERASPKLAALYSEIRALRKDISAQLAQLINTFSQKGVLQENFSDLRDGRYVIPVKISAQGEVDGIIYEASASRQTVFVEPREISPLNNRLRKLQNDLLQETFAVLQDTSARLRPFAPELDQGVAILSHWDAVQARARIARHYGGKSIHVVEERTFLLHQTAHPLLWWSMPAESIIRNEVEFDEPASTLLLTGPNTGGKTVLLKTLGLAGLCARTGFMFPAAELPQVPFFDAFFADLGDPQSIEHHLSSFSGHIQRFRDILDHFTERSLVLIDELNSATDPEEGAALGRAFLETLMEREAMIVATTHDPHLKALAMDDERVMNASMSFDETAMTPTYRIVLGVPGRSRALETAERLGLPKSVLARARSYLTREHGQFESVLARLESHQREAAQARRDAISIREEAERMRKEWTEKTQAAVGEMMEKARARLRRIMEQAQDEVRQSVRKLDEMRSRREIDQTRASLNQSLSSAVGGLDKALGEEAPLLAEVLQKAAERAPAPPEGGPKLEVGGTVRVPKWKNTAKVLEIQGSKIKVAMGLLQMTLHTSDVEPIFEKGHARSKTQPAFRDVDAPHAPGPQIDLRGVRFEEAMSQLEHYIDQAFRSGAYTEVVVVHGLGSGALREGARKILKRLPYVKEFKDGGTGRGGTGATVVEFDR